MLQNATLLRKSAPGPPNISDEHVSCTAPATENASLQIPFNAPHVPSFLEMLQNPRALLTFDKVHNPLRLPCETTPERPKVVRACGAFNLLTSKCPSHHDGVLFRHLNFQKCSEPVTCLHFWLRKVLRGTTACTFFDISTSVVRSMCCFNILTSKCASRHNGVHFFDISTSVVRTCVFLTCWLRNVLRATTACTFSTSQLQWSERVFF